MKWRAQQTGGKNLKVFLSYANDDHDRAEAICMSLRQCGHEVFFDRDRLPAGKEFDARIREEIERASVFVFLISPASLEPGRYSLTELEFAKMRWSTPHNHILPVMIGDVDVASLPNILKRVTILEPHGNMTAEVVAAVSRMRPKFSRSRLVAPGAAALLAAIALFAFGQSNNITAGYRAWSEPSRLPLSTAVETQLAEHIDEIAISLENFLYQLPQTEGRHTPWEVAQAAVALKKYYEQRRPGETVDNAAVDNAFHFMEQRLSASDRRAAFRNIANEDKAAAHLVVIESRIKGAAHVAATSWVLMTYGAYGRPPPEPLFDFIVDMQHGDGWWPIYANVDNDDENATVYATITAAWALLECIESDALTPEQTRRADAAIRFAAEWLGDLDAASTGGWPVYARRTGANASVSVTGNALFFLRETFKAKNINRALNRESIAWLHSLPNEAPAADGYEQSQDKIYDGDGALIGQDQTRYWLFPWTAAGLAATYDNGGLLDRMDALKRIERLIEEHEPGAAVRGRQWLEAEILIALLYLSESSTAQDA